MVWMLSDWGLVFLYCVRSHASHDGMFIFYYLYNVCGMNMIAFFMYPSFTQIFLIEIKIFLFCSMGHLGFGTHLSDHIILMFMVFDTHNDRLPCWRQAIYSTLDRWPMEWCFTTDSPRQSWRQQTLPILVGYLLTVINICLILVILLTFDDQWLTNVSSEINTSGYTN